MLAYFLAILVGIGSLTLYMSAFFFPEVHRRGDFIWSGIGLFYALILWLCAGRITGAVLLGETAGVSLLLWFGWQTLLLRRDLTPALEKTPVNSSGIAGKTSKFSGLFNKSSKQKKNVTTTKESLSETKESLSDQVATMTAVAGENIAEVATAVADIIPTVTETSDSLSGLVDRAVDNMPVDTPLLDTLQVNVLPVDGLQNLGEQLSPVSEAIATSGEEVVATGAEQFTAAREVVGKKIEEVLSTDEVVDKSADKINKINATVDSWGEVISDQAKSVTESVTDQTQGAITNISNLKKTIKSEKKSVGFARVLKPVTGFFSNFRKGDKSPTISKTNDQSVSNISNKVTPISEKVTGVISDQTADVVKLVSDNISDNINNFTDNNVNNSSVDNAPENNTDENNTETIDIDQGTNQVNQTSSPTALTTNTIRSDRVIDGGIEKEIVIFEELFDEAVDKLSPEDEVSIAAIDNPFQINETTEEIVSVHDQKSGDISSDAAPAVIKGELNDQSNNKSDNDTYSSHCDDGAAVITEELNDQSDNDQSNNSQSDNDPYANQETLVILEGISEVVTESVTTTVEKIDNDLIKAVQVTTTEVEVIYSQVFDTAHIDDSSDDSLDSSLSKSNSENSENIK